MPFLQHGVSPSWEELINIAVSMKRRVGIRTCIIMDLSHLTDYFFIRVRQTIFAILYNSSIRGFTV